MKQYAKYIKFLVLGLSVLFSPLLSSDAQTDATQPIFYLRDGNIWRYDHTRGTFAQETTWGYNEYPRLSYNGQYFAYNSIAAEVIRNLGSDYGIYPSDPYSNIWVGVANNTNDDDYQRIAPQPSTMIPPTRTNIGAGIARSTPSWSLNSLEVTWLEYDTTVSPAITRLVAHDMNTNTQRIIQTGLSLGFQDVGVHLPAPKFGYGVIAHHYTQAPDPSFLPTKFSYVIEFYDSATGTFLGRYVGDNETSPVVDFVWLADMVDTVGVLRRDNSIETYNVRTQSTVLITREAKIGAFSLANPSNRGAEILATYNGFTFNIDWEGRTSTGVFVNFTTETLENIALSPSGSQFAHTDETNALWVTRDGLLQMVPDSMDRRSTYVRYGPIWGPTAYHLHDEIDGTNNVLVCTSAAAPRLRGGMNARVIPGRGGASILRGAPATGVGSAELDRVPESTVVSVISGPFCGSGYNWYLVSFGGRFGYLAESNRDGVYWLEPA